MRNIRIDLVCFDLVECATVLLGHTGLNFDKILAYFEALGGEVSQELSILVVQMRDTVALHKINSIFAIFSIAGLDHHLVCRVQIAVLGKLVFHD